ncbi:hypothetical protein [Desertivirga xinjiangensis]|uniref:hypothetical protein n=1 Tax=Desertivirga xinjiangensis TaxID=539206 RepID=UPI00210DD502|nr:hypothetical protein [Pedobacter xinjiangensis]
MKNLFKFGFLAFAISLSVAACNSGKTENDTTDSLANSIDSTADVTAEALESQADTVDSAANASVDSLKN